MRKQHFLYILRWAAPKNGRTFFLDQHFSYYIVVKKFVTPGVFFYAFIVFNLKIVQSRLLLTLSREVFRTPFWIRFKFLIPNIIKWSLTTQDVNCFGYLFFFHVVWLRQHESWWHWDYSIGQSVRGDELWLVFG